MKEAVYFVKQLKIETYLEWKLYVSCHYNNVTYYNTVGEECPTLPDFVPPNIKTHLANYNKKHKNNPITIPDPNFVKVRKVRVMRAHKPGRKPKRRPPAKAKQIKISVLNLFRPESIINLDDYLSYNEAREYIKQYNIRCYQDWLQLVMNARNPNNTSAFIPSNIPDNPHVVYIMDDSWCHWGHFFNIKEREVKLKTYHIHKDKYLSYEEAKEFAHTLKLAGYYDWKLYTDCPKARDYYNKAGDVCAKKPITIPVKVKTHYMQTGEWVSWPDFLGYEEKVKIPLETLQQLAFENNITTIKGWQVFAKKHNYPQQLNTIYYDIWQSWKIFLGTVRYSYLDYYEAKKFLSTKSFQTIQQYTKWWDKEMPEFLPRDLAFYRTFCKDNGIEFSSRDFLSSGIVEKFNNMEDISVVYISCYNDEYVNNLISVSVDRQGLINASLTMKKKNQRLLGMFNLQEDTQLLKTLINNHCVKYSQGENNQYLVNNYHEFMNVMKNTFTEVVMPSMIT
jgi:hypothetical protein